MSVFTAENNIHPAHKFVKTAVNIHISNHWRIAEIRERGEYLKIFTELEMLEKLMPTQSRQSVNQIQFQQFSPPPKAAFSMAKILRPSKTEIILEPSAGTGSIAAWIETSGSSIHLNEISQRRRTLLELLKL